MRVPLQFLSDNFCYLYFFPWEMLQKENFDLDEFIVDEYLSTDVYYFNNISKGTLFIIQEVNNELVPYYTTWEMDENGVNTFPCESIKQSIELYRNVREKVKTIQTFTQHELEIISGHKQISGSNGDKLTTIKNEVEEMV